MPLFSIPIHHPNLGKWDEADNCYDDILKINPNQARVIGDKGVVQTSKGNYREALVLFNIALKIEPRNQRILKNREFALKIERAAHYSIHAMPIKCPSMALETQPPQLIFHKSMPKMFPRNPVLTLVNGGERVLMTLTPCAGIFCYPDKSQWPV